MGEVSRAAERAIATMEARTTRASVPEPADGAGWDELYERQEAAVDPANARALERYRPQLACRRVAGLPAQVVTPVARTATDARIVFVHGGAYTLFSARSTLFASVPLAHELGLELWSLDYPRAPHSRHDRTVTLVAEALAAACGDGARVLLVGDSAGGGLALAATLRLVAHGSSRPAALCLWSPWVDLSYDGARGGLDAVDPVLRRDPDLTRAALAYAPVTHLRDPEVSPVYASFPGDFPPTLIQCGTREILLPDAIRLHETLVRAGIRARLDVRPGMVHSYPAILPEVPEARRARKLVRRFFQLFG